MARSVTTFLMFQGEAEAALNLYADAIEGFEILSLERYGPGETGPEGKVRRALFTLEGQDFMAIDSPVEHKFGFTPSMSLFLECADEAELDGIFEMLAEGGQVLMPPDAYPFSTKFAWLADRFGVSWQLNLA